MNAFGDFLFTLRKEKGMTQAELAAALGVTNKAVSKWETGEAMPETGQLLPISRIFGVTVDELLAGRRIDNRNTCESKDEREEMQNFIEGHIFTRGKDDCAKAVRDKVCGAVCAFFVLAGVTAYFLVGLFTELWHPYWVIIPACALGSGILGIIFDLSNLEKRNAKLSRGENPYTSAACGILILSSVIVYLFLGALADLWHPYWVIIPVSATACAAIGALGNAFVNKNK